MVFLGWLFNAAFQSEHRISLDVQCTESLVVQEIIQKNRFLMKVQAFCEENGFDVTVKGIRVC